MLTNIQVFEQNDLVYLLAPYSSSLQSEAQKFRQDYIGLLAVDTKIDNNNNNNIIIIYSLSFLHAS